MGYETKLIIGTTTLNEGRDNYFMKYAEVDLCKIGFTSKINELGMFNTDETTSWYFYSTSGEHRITEDCYGSRFNPLPIHEYITKLKEDVENSDYRRFKWALALLEAMDTDSEPKYVIAYGH